MNNKKRRYLLIAYLTAFAAGCCIMAVEIIGGRLVARYLGASVYTWTSLIGVVLAGISLGNYIGGRIADRFPSRQALAALFISASLSCVVVPALNNLLGQSMLLLRFPWPVNILAHTALIFFLPSCLLGMISPVAVKFALDQGLKTGQTVGSIYAWGTGGSIAGTFMTGFILIPAIGTAAVIWTIAGILAFTGILYAPRSFFARAWVCVLLLLWFVSQTPPVWANRIASGLLLTDPDRENVVYAKDSHYAYVSVTKDKLNPRLLNLRIDNLTQTKINTDNPLDMNYAYRCHNLFAAIVKNIRPLKENPLILNLGGGGYIVPRYIKEYLPQSRVEAVEIDPEVTRAAVRAFGLSEDDGISIHHTDARNYIEQRSRQEDKELFDFILSDVLAGIAVPYHLTTYEYNEKIAGLLAPEGLYVINMIDAQESPRFLLAMSATLGQTFDYVYVLSTEREAQSQVSGYGTYVIIASQKAIDKAGLDSLGDAGQLLDMQVKEGRGDLQTILTDDYAPVESLLKEAFRAKGEFIRCAKMVDTGAEFIAAGRSDKALGQFENALRINPDLPAAYHNIASIKARQGQYEQAIEYYGKALERDPRFIQAMIGLGSALEKTGRRKEAIAVFIKVLQSEPNLAGVYTSLGNALFAEGEVAAARENYRKALEIEPSLEAASRNLEAIVKAEDRRE